LVTGINFGTENFPDKDYLIISIATFSAGADEIFDKNYVPKPEDLRKQPPQALMVDNSDGLFDGIDPSLYKTKKGRRMNLSACTAQDKLNVRVAKKQIMIAKC
jgi:hypothetical protein